MSRETTPPKITPMILDCCKTLNSQILPFYVDVIPDPDAIMNECFPNVQRKIARGGGTYMTGWTIWQWANIMIEAEAHSIWKNENGKMIDITPHSHQERQILFVPDKSVKFEGVIIPNKRAPMTKSLKVARLRQSGGRFPLSGPFKAGFPMPGPRTGNFDILCQNTSGYLWQQIFPRG